MKRSAPIFSRITSSGTINGYGVHASDKYNISEENSSYKDTDVSDNSDKFMQTPLSRGTNLVRSTSIPSIKFGMEEKQGGSRLTLARPIGSTEKTPVTHFCTPRRNKQMKRYFSEFNLHKPPATPDCYAKVHVETPRIKTDPEDVAISLGEETSNLTVGVRVRPLNARESNDSAVTNVVSVDGGEVKVSCDSGSVHSFTYDHCFWSCDPHHPQFASQEVVFTTIMQPLIDKAFQGYNASLFAYGQTGSGKSYSMMGLGVESGHCFGSQVGIIPRFCHELFERIASLDDSSAGCIKSLSETACVEISYFEIYNEKIHDLLGGTSEGGKRPPLKVREHPQFGPYVVDLSVHGVTSYEELQGWLTVGNSQRATAATGMNEKSSRSHSIFSVILTQTQEEMVNEECHKLSRRSKINLVDLAGSERLSQTCASGERLREGVSINRSLLTLGKVIAALADNGNSKRKVFVPYRDSVLTWLLRESLGGNSRTTMLATISPANIHIDETLATLRYACQARTIVNRVRVNEDPHDRLVRELRAEIERLRSLREDYEREVPRLVNHKERNEMLQQELVTVREQLKQSEEHLARSQKLVAELNEALKKAKQDVEEATKTLGLEKLNYEQQVKNLEDSLDQQKSALLESQRIKSQLEIRNEALEAEFQRRLAMEEVTTLPIPTSTSDFLQEFEAVLNETVSLDSSQYSSSSDSSLHDLSLGVEEANQLCKQFHINFNLQQHHTMVRVEDLDKHRVSYWKPSSFFQWLHQLRDYDPNDSLEELLDVEESWQEESRKLNGTIDTSCYNDSALESSHNTTQQDCSTNGEDVNSCILSLESTTHTLRMLCKEQRSEDINTALRSLETAVQQLRCALYKPAKSNLKSSGYTPRAHKAVRFFLSSSQMSQ